MLIAYQVALEVVRELRPLVEKIRKHDSTLAKQLVDAASSTVQNIAEGERHRAGNKRLKYDIAFGEANEVKGSLDLAIAWGYIVDNGAARAKLMRLHALLWGLTRGKGTPREPSRRSTIVGQTPLCRVPDYAESGSASRRRPA